MSNTKIQELFDIEGYEDDQDFYDNGNPLDSIQPGICMNEDCDCVVNVEPDQREGWCELCDTATVESITSLLGIC